MIKLLIAILSGMIWIYFRDDLCYSLIPRKNIKISIFVGIWIFLNYYEPLFLPIGLFTLYLYSFKYRKKKRKN